MNSESRNGALRCELSNNQQVYEKDLRVMKDSMRRENELMRKKLHEVEKNYNSVDMELRNTQRKYYQCQSDVHSLRKMCSDVVETLHEEKESADFWKKILKLQNKYHDVRNKLRSYEKEERQKEEREIRWRVRIEEEEREYAREEITQKKAKTL